MQALSTTLASITKTTGITMAPQSWSSVAGSAINQVGRLTDISGHNWFIKLNSPDQIDMFAAECDGLSELAAANDICIPEVAGYGSSDRFAWLVVQWLEFSPATKGADRQFGRALAHMHKVTAERFGWRRDNYIGTTTQPNGWHRSWPEFFRIERLGHQFELAQKKGVPISFIDSGHRLMARIEDWFVDYSPVSSLLHGDLWGGNRAALADGTPVLFDPAVYFGDRETDIAMTHLFGGFSAEFYSAYVKAWPLDKGATQRQALYNLYHILNHFNLFGGSYLMQAEQLMQQLLAR